MQLLSQLLVIIAAWCALSSARQLGAAADGQSHATGSQSQGSSSDYAAVVANSSCHGFLIGIGTQKGGTTALWAYISDKAHPHLRVSKTKELGFWDNLHTRYAGCRVGDYLQLQTQDEAQSSPSNSSKQLPICPSNSRLEQQQQQVLLSTQPGAAPRPGSWSTSSAGRLALSRDCSIFRQAVQHRKAEQQVQEKAQHLQQAEADPAWTGVMSARLLQQDEPSTSPAALQAAPAAVPAILGAPAQFRPPVYTPGAQPVYHADITPRYLLDPAVPLRVGSLLPEARLVVILRDPVSRAISNYNMWKQKAGAASLLSWSEALQVQVDAEISRLSACYTAVGTAAALQPELAACLGLSHAFAEDYDQGLFANRLLAQGLYADLLQRWFNVFPAESFLVWVSEDFKSDPATHMTQLIQWLGLDLGSLDPKHHSASHRYKPVHSRRHEGSPDPELVARMRQFFEPHNARLFALLESKGFGAVAARMRQVWAE